VTDFIEACQPKHQIKIIRFLSLLESHGPTLSRPYADLLYDGIHEFRIKLSGEQIRLLYFFCHQKYIILYEGFTKHTNRVPDKIIQKVSAYRDQFLKQITREYLEEVIREDI